MPNELSDSDSLSQAEMRALLTEAKARFSPTARATERATLTAKTGAGESTAPPTLPMYVMDPRSGNWVPTAIHEERVARTRARNTPTKRRSRAKIKAEIAALCADLGPPVAVKLTAAERLHEGRCLRAWLAIGGRRQQQFKPLEKRYLGARIVSLEMRREFEIASGDVLVLKPAAFARRLSDYLREPITRSAALQMLKQLASLEADGGPWSATR